MPLVLAMLLLALPARAVEPPPALAASRPAPKPAEEPVAEDEHLRGEVSMGTVTNLGILPRVAFGADVDAGFRWRWFALAAEGRLLATPRFSVSPDRSADALALLGILKMCAYRPFVQGRYFMESCALVGAGRMALQVDSGVESESVHPFTMFTGLRFGAGWQVASFLYLKSFVELGIVPVQAHLSFNGATVWRESPVFGTLGIQFGAVMNPPTAWARPEPSTAER